MGQDLPDSDSTQERSWKINNCFVIVLFKQEILLPRNRVLGNLSMIVARKLYVLL